MAFNCPHMCSSLRLFRYLEGGTRKLEVDVRTSFAKSLEENIELALHYINRIIQKINESNNTQGVNGVSKQ